MLSHVLGLKNTAFIAVYLQLFSGIICCSDMDAILFSFTLDVTDLTVVPVWMTERWNDE